MKSTKKILRSGFIILIQNPKILFLKGEILALIYNICFDT